MKAAIIGAGSFGTALSIVLSKKHEVTLWCRRKEQADQINQTKINNTYLQNIKLPENIIATTNKEDISSAEIVIFAIPSSYLREIASQFSSIISEQAHVIHVVKGIEAETGKLPSQVLREELGKEVAVLSGPNHAEEIANNSPTATVIASVHKDEAKHLCEVISTENFKAYPHNDVIGVEICSVLKNIVAIAMGVCDGLQLGDNAKGSITTLGLAEMSAIASQFGAKKTTPFGLAGVGDLIATCFSKHSRNRFVGEMLTQNKSIDQIKQEMHGMVAEGIKNTKTVYELVKKQGVEPPLITTAYKVLYQNLDLEQAINQLLKKV